MMRLIISTLLILAISLLHAQNDPVLFTVDKSPIHLSEFKYIYEKNNSDNADYSKESLEEYLELYKKFKLKVRRAKDIGLDTVKVLQDELAGYRKQLAKSYLKDKEISEKLIEQVILRMKQDVEVSHIFVASPPKSSEESKKNAESKVNDIYDKLMQNKGQFFSEMAKSLSEDKISSKRGGRLGFYTAPLPDGFYEFENAMYETEVGNISKPIKSKMGFHIIHVQNKRPARGQMEIAHILIRKENPTRRVDSKVLVDSVYNLLKEDRNFENMAGKFSEDEKTKGKGGYLGFFGINQYELSFENAAFDLEKNDDFTKPIETSLGYHIIKRLNKRDDSDVVKLRKRIETRIRNNDRFSIAESKLIEDVKEEAGFEEDKLMFKRFSTALNQDFYSYKWEVPEYGNDLVIFKLDNKEHTLGDFAEYTKKNVRERLKFSKTTPLDVAAKNMYDLYVKEQVLAYEEINLEKKYPDFRALMQEYREGILLFEITKQEVWDKASQDTAGLQSFYSKNKNNYQWPERAKLIKYSIEAKEQQKVLYTYQQAQKNNHDKFLGKFLADDNVKLKYKEEMVEKGSDILSNMEHKKDAVSQLLLNPPPATFYRYVENIPPGTKTLAEAKGYVIADYQDYLEKHWIDDLQSKYPVDINKKTLKSIIK